MLRMTTATRKLRVFTSADSVYPLPSHVHSALGMPSHNSQGTFYVTAATKAAAVAHLRAAGFGSYLTPRDLRVATGSIRELAVRDAGMLDADGSVVAYHLAQLGNPVVAVAADNSCAIVGQWNHVASSDRGRRPGLWLYRLSDGAEFPCRASGDPATPATGWTAEIEVVR
jgi:hypothetical protein